MNKVNEKCTLCFQNFDEINSTQVLGCNHRYHSNCITKWNLKHNFCPLCRLNNRNKQPFNEIYYNKKCLHNGCRLNHNYCCKCLDYKTDWIQYNKSFQNGDRFVHYCSPCYDYSWDEFNFKYNNNSKLNLKYSFPSVIEIKINEKKENTIINIY
jgi:hypothetical protein